MYRCSVFDEGVIHILSDLATEFASATPPLPTCLSLPTYRQLAFFVTLSEAHLTQVPTN